MLLPTKAIATQLTSLNIVLLLAAGANGNRMKIPHGQTRRKSIVDHEDDSQIKIEVAALPRPENRKRKCHATLEA